MSNGNGSTALAVVCPAPTSLADVKDLSLSAAKSGLYGIRSEHEALVRLMTGLELGIPAMTSLRCISVVSGKPVLDATLVAALAQRHPDCVSWRVVETTAEMCTIETVHRRNGKSTVTWTMADAKRAKLDGKDNWRNYPRAMLRARATTELARMAYPEAFAGLYSPEELGGTVIDAEVRDVPAATTQPTPAPEPSQPLLHRRGL